MRTFLQKYENQTRYLFAASVALVALGIYLYVQESHGGVPVALLGGAGLVWCFLRR